VNLTDDYLKELDDPSLTDNERVLLRCRLAARLIHEGQYETAREALGELWQGVGKHPDLKGLPPAVAADVLLQCGMLSGCLGSARNISGAQEKAIELLFESLRTFKSLRQPSKVSEVKYALSMCYWRLGAFDRAREVLDDALKGLGEQDAELKAKLLIRQTLVEVWTGRYYEAWGILDRAREFFEASGDALKGRWHGQKAIVLLKLALTQKRPDYADRAIIEFTAAIFHYERAGHERYCGTNHNNLAVLLYQMGRYAEAHENLDRAQRIFERHNDPGNLAQVNETRARVLVAEHRYEEANRVIAGVIPTFEKSGERALLADAMTIQGVAWARLSVHESSIHILHRAITVAQDSGAFPNAGQAALTLIEEHGASRLSETELYTIYRRADNLLKDTQDIEDIMRLRACARIVTRRLAGARLGTKDFSLPKAVLAFEAKFIREALRLEKGSVSRAAKRLGVRHQTLTHLLETRHRDLLSLRTPAKPRPRSVLSQAQKRGRENPEK
jgi:tetratricopeptide (TPR) repeat protein